MKWSSYHSVINHYHFKLVRAFSTSPPTAELNGGGGGGLFHPTLFKFHGTIFDFCCPK